MYHHHIKKEFTKAGQVNPELIFEKMGTVYSQGQAAKEALKVLAYGPDLG